MDRPDLIGDPAQYINSRPETNAPYADPVPLPPGVTEPMDEQDYPQPTFTARCGAPGKDFERYGYCDRLASKDGDSCYQHA